MSPFPYRLLYACTSGSSRSNPDLSGCRRRPRSNDPAGALNVSQELRGTNNLTLTVDAKE